MEQAVVSSESDVLYPALIIPKRCTTLETSCELTDNVFIDLNITSVDTEGNEMCIYNGFCNVKLIDRYDVNVQQVETSLDSTSVSFNENEAFPTDVGTQVTCSSYNQSHVWIDPVRSPHVYNSYDSNEIQEYSICPTPAAHITVEQHHTYITQNVYNYKDSIQYSLPEDFEHKKFRKLPVSETPTISMQAGDQANFSFYEEDEFECGVFLSQLPEEILNEKECKAREERKYIGLQSDNEALKQLMSSDIQSVSKQRKTILFLGHDSHCGQTIQKIAVNDPSLVCSGGGEVDHEVVIDEALSSNPRQKKYQCDKCKQIFDQIAAFKRHMVGSHRTPRTSTSESSSTTTNDMRFMCTECGKSLKNQEKFEIHCMGHGDPEVECNKCHKVFASKFTLRTHRKIHNRTHMCRLCCKSFSSLDLLKSHSAKKHFVYMCETCDFVTESYTEIGLHEEKHNDQAFNENRNDQSFITESNNDQSFITESNNDQSFITESNNDQSFITETNNDQSFIESSTDVQPFIERNSELTEAVMEEMLSDTDIIVPSPEGHAMKLEGETASSFSQQDEIQKADSVIAKVMSNKIFLLHSNKARRNRRYNKACNVCFKVFDRVGDLKRHLIEHVIRSTLAKTPVSKEGTLNINCEICQSETFSKVDRYKAHLREHAKLTIYQCTFCDKSFSDSSNFSKHKKIHGTTYFQCDLCQRKFNSKKMITQHMEYHNKNAPLKCLYCARVFHFESMLNKHVKCAHIKELSNRFRCKFCQICFKTLKEKWDHEWTIHHVRKMIVDCLICGAKFRKYSELKKHCIDKHDMEIPLAKKLLKKKRFK